MISSDLRFSRSTTFIRRFPLIRAFGLCSALAILSAVPARVDAQPAQTYVVEKLGDHLFRIGSIRVDTSTLELTVAGKVNGNVSTLEFVANTKGGFKAYESAIELDTNAVMFNAACLLIGLDPAHASHPTRHFDPKPPEGDEVQVTVKWQDKGAAREIDAGQLLYDREKKRAVSNNRWVYTGSMMLDSGWYLADADGVLIGFVHSPAPIIENVASDAVGRYGMIIMNPELGLAADTPITVTVKAVRSGRQ